MRSGEHKIGVIGGGSWGTAMVKLLSANLSQVNWWVRNKDNVDYIKRYKRNPNYFSYQELNLNRINVSPRLEDIISNSDYIIFAVPAAFLRQTLQDITDAHLKNKVIISAIKGIIPEDNLIISNFFESHYNIPQENLGVIGGPCHSEEVAMEKLSFLTLAFRDQEKAEILADFLTSRYLKISFTKDIEGAEYAAVIKNIIAIANGICIGLGYGDNFQSVLIVNAIQEMRRFLEKINSIERDINNSVYLGDLIVTAYSKFSRNRTFGNMIGKGYSPQFAQIEMKMIAEGYYAVKGLFELNKVLQVDLPVVTAVYRILHENCAAGSEMQLLAGKLH